MAADVVQKLRDCTAAFKQAIAGDALAFPGGSELANQYDRLKLWAHDVDIWSETLHDRLAKASALCKLLAEILNDLHEEIVAVSVLGEADRLEDISDLLDNLFSLESTVKTPAPLDAIESPVSDHLAITAPQLRKLSVVFQSTRRLADNSDADIVIIGMANSEFARHALNWCETLLPSFLQEHDIHARVMSFAYENSCWLDRTHKTVVHDFVQELNSCRVRDPERPLHFIAHGLASFIVKDAISTLIAEGLSVDMAYPVSGCTFLDVPKQAYTLADIGYSGEGILPDPGQIDAARWDMTYINYRFQEVARKHTIEVHEVFGSEGELIMQPETHDTTLSILQTRGASLTDMRLNDREIILPIAHKVAQTAEMAIIARRDALAHEGSLTDIQNSRVAAGQTEDPFAILVAYSTAILVNDCSVTSESIWTSMLNIVRDCIDIVSGGYRDELDLQLQYSEQISYGMRDSSTAARILSNIKLPGQPWHLTKQLRDYITEYLTNESSVLGDGSLCPCNIVVLTQDVPADQNPEDLLQTLSSIARVQIDNGFKTLPLHIQIVYLTEDAKSLGPKNDDFFARLDNINRSGDLQGVKIAPTFRLNHKYVSNAEICKRILLGALSSRFETISFTSKDLGRLVEGRVSHRAGSITSSADGSDDIFTRGSETQPTGSTAASSVDLDFGRARIESFRGHIYNVAGGSDREKPQPHPSKRVRNDLKYFSQPSSYLPESSFFEPPRSSPLLEPQQDPAFDDRPALQRSSLGKDDLSRDNFETAFESPLLSPNLMPELRMTAEDDGGKLPYGELASSVTLFPPLSKPQAPDDFGHADPMSPPEINVEFAPPSSFTSLSSVSLDLEALDRPERPQGSKRMRAKSDSRSSAPTHDRSTSPKIQAHDDSNIRTFRRSPSPSPPPSGGRGRGVSSIDQRDPALESAFSGSNSPSPARRRTKSASRAGSSSQTAEQRDYILNLAEPERTPSATKDYGRVQKHPATFQCHLCPKRFTRAYNLRSHLRTHTDERPFVCTVCGKAFARQHDRKRHEGLHSGEKKFVCKGQLQSGVPWGCGRRFARADALGRHFRSEAGRVCIKPLLDEEAAERQKAWMEELEQAQAAADLGAPQPLVALPLHPEPMDTSGDWLPKILLQQYPALQHIDWSTIPTAPPVDDEHSGRDSFDADSSDDEPMYYSDPEGKVLGTVQGGINVVDDPDDL